MTRNQLYPLEVNPHTREPFLRLPAPNDNIILTPPRWSDEKCLAPIINDPGISIWLEGPPIPYRDEYAPEWLTLIKGQSDGILKELEEERLRPEGPLKLVGGYPVRHIREVLPDGTEVYLGDIGIGRAQLEEVLDPEDRKRAVEENNSKPIGDPSIVWTFGGTYRYRACFPTSGIVADCAPCRLPCLFAPWTGNHDRSDEHDIEWVGDSEDGGSDYDRIYVQWERRKPTGIREEWICMEKNARQREGG